MEISKGKSNRTRHLTSIPREDKNHQGDRNTERRTRSRSAVDAGGPPAKCTRVQSPGPRYKHMPVIDTDLKNPILSPIEQPKTRNSTIGSSLTPQCMVKPHPRLTIEEKEVDYSSVPMDICQVKTPPREEKGLNQNAKIDYPTSKQTAVNDNTTSRNLTRPHRVSAPQKTRAPVTNVSPLYHHVRIVQERNPSPRKGTISPRLSTMESTPPRRRPRHPPLPPPPPPHRPHPLARPPLHPPPPTPLQKERRTSPIQLRSRQSLHPSIKAMTERSCAHPQTLNSSIESSEYPVRTSDTRYHCERSVKRLTYSPYKHRSIPYSSSSYSSLHSREKRYGEKSAVPRSYTSSPYRSSSTASSWRKRCRPLSTTPLGNGPNVYKSLPYYRSRSSSVSCVSQAVEAPPTSNGLPVSRTSRPQVSATGVKGNRAAPQSGKSEQPTPSLLSSEGPLPLSAKLSPTNSSVLATKIPITLRTYWYSPFLLLKANTNSRQSPQDGLYETMIVERNGMKLTRWRTSQSPPYFTRVEYDAGLREKASRTSNSLFHRYVTERGIIEPIRKLLDKYEKLHREATDAICEGLSIKYHVRTRKRENLVGWWPVGKDGMIEHSSTCLNTSVFGNMAKDVINSNIKWNGISTRSVRNIMPQSIVTLKELVSVFHLSDCAARRVLSGERSLLAEVSRQCRCWERERMSLQVPDGIPSSYIDSTQTVSPDELYYECKFGVYFVPGRSSVFKFLTQRTLYPEFVWEVALGLSVAPIKGVVSIKNVCPEAFCFEMDFAGINLDEVINGDTIGLRQHSESSATNPPVLQQCLKMSPKLTCLYAVRMIAARGDLQYRDPALSKKVATVYDTYHAGQIACVIREKLLNDLPFTMAEMVNIITRLSQQGIVNPDIKCDNFVIDPITGQPSMIDFGLVIPEGSTSRTQYTYEPGQYPQSTKEYLSGKKCTTDTMTFGLAYTFMDMLHTLILRTGNPGVAAIYYNIEFLDWMASAYSDIPKERPSVVKVAKVIGKCFPLPSKVSELFDNPRQTLY